MLPTTSTPHLAAVTPLFDGPAVIVAHSAGAILAVALAARRPDLVSGLLVLGLPAFPDTATARRSVGGLGLLARLTAEERPSAAVLHPPTIPHPRWVVPTLGGWGIARSRGTPTNLNVASPAAFGDRTDPAGQRSLRVARM